MNPERRFMDQGLTGIPLHLRQVIHDSNQCQNAASLLVIRIRCDSGRNLVAKEGAAHGDCPY